MINSIGILAASVALLAWAYDRVQGALNTRECRKALQRQNYSL